MWGLRDHYGTLSSGFATTFPQFSLFTKGDDSAKTVPVRCFLDGHVFGLVVPMPPPFSIGFTQEANISLEEGVGQIWFLSAVCIVFHSQYQSTLIPVPPSISPS